jgi:branched-subunit amino acid ABC-type transport system permease component
MDQVILFAFLGVGSGVAYALTALGLVAIYKGSGVVNFAQGAVAMFSAFCYTSLTSAGIGTIPAAVFTCLGAAAAGVGVYMGIMRPLRSAAPLAQLVATIGILITLSGVAVLLWSTEILSGVIAPSLLPAGTFDFAGATVSVDRFWLLLILAVLVPILWAVFRFTTFGLSTRAVAESERGASLLGFSPTTVAAGNWALGFALAAVAGILIAPISALNVTSLTLMVLPALAAALCGRFSSFGVTAVAGLLIGVGQSLVTRYSDLQGIGSIIPLVVILAAVSINGRRIQQRGTVIIGRPPKAADGRIKLTWIIALPVLVIGALALVDRPYQAAVTTSMVGVILALSVVVVTGLVGQVNLAPLTFAGVGAFSASWFGENLGLPFPLPILLGAFVAVPLGLVLGLPALRIRGINLAIVTLGAAVAMDAAVIQNYTVSGGTSGRPVPAPSLLGFEFPSSSNPFTFGIFVFVVMSIFMLLVSRIRRSGIGRRMLAVRGNERAAAAAGINVAAVKLAAFGISAFIAAAGGAVLAYQFGATTPSNFRAMASLTLVALVFIGGIASVSGAFAAGMLTSGGIVFVLLNQIEGFSHYWDVFAGALLILTVVTQPDGLALKNMELRVAAKRRLQRPVSAPLEVENPVPPRLPPSLPRTHSHGNPAVKADGTH